MKTKLLLLLSSLALFSTTAALAAEHPNEKNCGCSCCTGKEVCCCFVEESAAADQPSADSDSDKTSDTAIARHPLRGVIVAVRPNDSALLVKHDEIPGYMRAMTMLFKVDAAALSAFKKGDAITGTLVQREDGFYLENISKR